MVGPAAVRESVAHLRTMFEISERRTCSIVKADPLRNVEAPRPGLLLKPRHTA